MQTITLELKNKEDAEIILSIAKRLEGKVLKSENEIKTPKPKLKFAFSHLDRIAKKGNLKKTIPDPVAWQKEIRKDRKLPGR